ncbi:hypothetical protein AV530_016164 [Patagioenas fasciata monilis]|uniref:Uncharacterized protein n=1 Tax=Patagioenas fasciata monilis TaxID=372326 RepID=A0A1V4JWH8_PATFA|nr:hypothetical protein AV530_016164 [Patagioenas fasciata monilis]
MPASFKMDLLLTKARLISDSVSTSVITYLRRRKKRVHLQPERGMRICERNNSADAQVSEEGGGGGGSGTRAEIPLYPMMKTMGRLAAPMQLVEVRGATGGCLKETVILWEVHAGASSWQKTWREEPMLEQDYWLDL